MYVVISHIDRIGYVHTIANIVDLNQFMKKIDQFKYFNGYGNYEEVTFFLMTSAIKKFVNHTTSASMPILMNYIGASSDGRFTIETFYKPTTYEKFIDEFIEMATFQQTLFDIDALDKMDKEYMKKNYKEVKLGRGFKMYVSEYTEQEANEYPEIGTDTFEYLINDVISNHN